VLYRKEKFTRMEDTYAIKLNNSELINLESSEFHSEDLNSKKSKFIADILKNCIL